MPIKRENLARYPKDWHAIRGRILARAGRRCECLGECGLDHGGRCPERDRTKARQARGLIVLTVAHLDHTPENNAPDNLRAMCQRCHLRYDATHHAANAGRTRDRKRGQKRLFDDDPRDPDPTDCSPRRRNAPR